MTAQKKQHLGEIKLHKLSHGGRDKRTWGKKKKKGIPVCSVSVLAAQTWS